MIRHDVQLWAYAARELELGDHRYVESHLEDCPECVEQLAAVQVAQEALDLAREAKPKVGWSRLDAYVGRLVEKQLQAQARGPLFKRLGFGFAGLATAAAVMTFVLTRPDVPPVEMDQPGPVSASWARIDRAQGLMKVGGAMSELSDGMELRGGDVLRTVKTGKAFVHLPDGSHVRLGGASQVALTRSDVDDVALTLERGTLAVRASHQERKGFVVHSGGLSVNVVGTVFGVTNDAEQVEVSVSEGRVRVELPSGESVMVEPGQRLRFDPKSQKVKKLKLSPLAERDLSEVAAVADATTSVEQRAVVPAAGGKPSSPPLLEARGQPRTLPRLSPQEAQSRQVEAPVVTERPEPVVEEKKVDIVIQEPDTIWPSIGGGEVIRGVPAMRQVEPPPATQPTEWAEAPKPSEEEWAAMPAPVPAPSPKLADEEPKPAPAVTPAPKKNLEAVFLERAEASVGQGTCEKFLAGLEEIADDTKSSRSELARVLRARCFESQMRPRLALTEYRKYLDAHPKGAFVAEANGALGE
jgi:hypothetical protein